MLRLRVKATAEVSLRGEEDALRSVLLAANPALTVREVVRKAAGSLGASHESLVLHVDGFALAQDERVGDLLRDDDLVQ